MNASIILLGLTLWGVCTATALGAVPPTIVESERPVRSLQSLRYRDVLGQQEWYTCGAAAVATWLTHFLGHEVSEEEVLQVANEAMVNTGREIGEGLTLLSLRDALGHFAVKGVGYRVPVTSLITYFGNGGLPVLMHVTRPELHYVLAVGFLGDQFLIADPSYGRRSVSVAELVEEKGFEGIVMVAMVDDDTALLARAKQESFVADFERRFAQLRSARELMVR